MEDALTTYLEESHPRQLADLQAWLRIPSISTLAGHKADVKQAATWLMAQMRQAGLEHVELIETETQPMVYADWLHAGPDQPTVLIYGHFDVQPVDPLRLWATPPFEPTVRGENLYARGASDDKGQTFLHVKAVEALLQTRGAIGNLPSTMGERASAGDPSYSTSKHAVRGLTQSAALTYAGQGVRINSVGPGVVKTGMTSAIFEDEQTTAWLMSDASRSRARSPS